jgi:hypothetical protein
MPCEGGSGIGAGKGSEAPVESRAATDGTKLETRARRGFDIIMPRRNEK